jgi:D-beta-D-heptose 7-phosphate kinase/D-beta-D-heptose 1-phosphate adenosyltransferase
MKILVVGETCKDVFNYGKVERLCPEAPVPVFNLINTTQNKGMAGNVASNLKSLGAEVTLLTNLNWEEISKTRFIEKKTNHMFLRLDCNDDKYGKCSLSSLDYTFWDAIILSDYNKGFLSKEDIKLISSNHPLTFLDTKKPIGKWCEDISFIKINNYEITKAEEITEVLNSKLIITLGADGAKHKNKIYSVPKVEIKDLSGAGDTFISALCIKYVETKNIDIAIEFANQCATKVVQKAGVSVV